MQNYFWRLACLSWRCAGVLRAASTVHEILAFVHVSQAQSQFVGTSVVKDHGMTIVGQHMSDGTA